MFASTKLTLTFQSPLRDLHAFGQSNFTEAGPLDIVRGSVRKSTALFKGSCPKEVVSYPSDTAVIDSSGRSESVTWGTLDCTALGDLDLDVLAAVLARVDNVDAIYVDDSAGATHIWTVLSVYNDAALDAVFDRELELYGYFGKQLASVEFHVLSSKPLTDSRMGRRVFKRVC